MALEKLCLCFPLLPLERKDYLKKLLKGCMFVFFYAPKHPFTLNPKCCIAVLNDYSVGHIYVISL